MKAEWKSGNLILSANTPSDALNAWLKLVEQTPVLPGLEFDTVSKEN
jgi:hypothetical protein